MSHWNHRVVRIAPVEPDDEVRFEVVEMFYRHDEGRVGWTPPSFMGESVDGLRKTVKQMAGAFTMPVLDSVTLKEVEV